MQQTDLLAPPPETSENPPTKGKSREKQHAKWAKELEQSGNYRVLRRMTPRPILHEPLDEGEKIGVTVDVETTGLDHAKNEIIELVWSHSRMKLLEMSVGAGRLL